MPQDSDGLLSWCNYVRYSKQKLCKSDQYKQQVQQLSHTEGLLVNTRCLRCPGC